MKKLFGHDTELICTMSTAQRPSNDSRILLASTAKARDAAQATIRLWDVSKGSCVQELGGVHQSTVVALGFSNQGSYLVSVSNKSPPCL